MTASVIADSIVNLCGAIGLSVAMVALHRRDPRSPLTRRLLVMLGVVAVLFLILGIAHPHVAGAGFLLAAIPFLFIFVSGVLADLLETRYRPLVMACIVGMMAAYVIWSLVNLVQVPRG